MLEQAMAFSPQDSGGSYQTRSNAVGKTVMRLDPQARTAGPMPHFGGMVDRSLQTSGENSDNNIQSPEETFGFFDFLDIINPLQHIPVVATFYQKITGDTIKPACQIAGGALFGGPIGAIASTINAMVEESNNGKGITESTFSLAGIDLGQSAQTAKVPTLDYSPPQKAQESSVSGQMMAYQKNFAAQPPSPLHSWNA